MAVAKTGMLTVGMGKTGLSNYLDSRKTGERETLRMALRFLTDLGRVENLDIILWFWDRMMYSTWNVKYEVSVRPTLVGVL